MFYIRSNKMEYGHTDTHTKISMKMKTKRLGSDKF